MALTSSEIENMILSDDMASNSFLGVFPLDKLPFIKDYPASCIINTHPSNMPGEHWIAFYIDSEKTCIFFDSYGRKPGEFGVDQYLKRFSNQIQYNKSQFQSFNSSSCGYYCVFFIRLISRSVDLKKITFVFSKKTFIINDIFVKSIMELI